MNFEDNRGRERVVVTGMGAVTPLGNREEMWASLLRGQSGISVVDRLNFDHVPVHIAGEIKAFNPTKWLSKKDSRRMARVSQLAVVASAHALCDSGIDKHMVDHERVGTVIGTTMGPHLLAESMTSEYRANGHQRPNPIAFANCLPNMPAHYVSRYLQAFGPLNSPSAACATGTQAIGEGVELIRAGRADVVFAGGTEAIIRDYIIAGFASMSALATGFESEPARASRPFDANRSGFVISEGSAVFVLESLSHAMQRKADIYAEVVGYAVSADAYHIAVIDPDAKGMIRAMQWALDDAGLDAWDIDYINAHGTGTPANDRFETLAIKTVFGSHAQHLPISSNKSMLGHAMAAAGAIEGIATVLTMMHNQIPPTINYDTVDPDCDLDYVPNVARDAKRPIRYGMSNNFGLGGQNASIIFARFQS